MTVEHGIWTRVSHSLAEIAKGRMREWPAAVFGASELLARECRAWGIHDVMARSLPDGWQSRGTDEPPSLERVCKACETLIPAPALPAVLLDSTGRRGFVRKRAQKCFLSDPPSRGIFRAVAGDGGRSFQPTGRIARVRPNCIATNSVVAHTMEAIPLPEIRLPHFPALGRQAESSVLVFLVRNPKRSSPEVQFLLTAK